MRISEYFHLGTSQPYLDFVDVDTNLDTKLFIDPTALLPLQSEWASECVALIQNFFQVVVGSLANGDRNRAAELMSVLHEPNETHLGMSHGRSRGRGLGPFRAYDMVDSLQLSGAIGTGMLQDLEDTILMIEGVGPDLVSDIATNIIRAPLITYTQAMAELYGIALSPGIESGALWDPRDSTWFNELVDLPVTDSGKLLLVPKVIVRRKLSYDYDAYFRNYILPFLGDIEMEAKSSIVRVLKNGKSLVTKSDLEAKYGRGKRVVVEQTRLHPEILQHYRDDTRDHPRAALTNLDLAHSENVPTPEFSISMESLREIASGPEDAQSYHQEILRVLTRLFYPCLSNPRKEAEIHSGRKRVDILFVNAATDGFFQWLSRHYSAPHVFVECKNYSGDPANPELDQLSGRFSPSRGQIGLLVCRQIADKELFLRRCRDTASDGRGFIIPLDDSDIEQLIEAGTGNDFGSRQFKLLKERFDQLVM